MPFKHFFRLGIVALGILSGGKEGLATPVAESALALESLQRFAALAPDHLDAVSKALPDALRNAQEECFVINEFADVAWSQKIAQKELLPGDAYATFASFLTFSCAMNPEKQYLHLGGDLENYSCEMFEVNVAQRNREIAAVLDVGYDALSERAQGILGCVGAPLCHPFQLTSQDLELFCEGLRALHPGTTFPEAHPHRVWLQKLHAISSKACQNITEALGDLYSTYVESLQSTLFSLESPRAMTCFQALAAIQQAEQRISESYAPALIDARHNFARVQLSSDEAEAPFTLQDYLTICHVFSDNPARVSPMIPFFRETRYPVVIDSLDKIQKDIRLQYSPKLRGHMRAIHDHVRPQGFLYMQKDALEATQEHVKEICAFGQADRRDFAFVNGKESKELVERFIFLGFAAGTVWVANTFF